jgi:hypothetical protein
MRSLALAFACLLSACATTPPPQVPTSPPARLGLRLAPSALGASISLQQQLHVVREGRTDDLEAALEVDATQLNLVGLAMGQRVMTLSYDGVKLSTWRHALLPQQVQGEDVLEDIQLTYWPTDAIRAALPAGWTIDDDGTQRRLWANGELMARIGYSANPRWEGPVVFDNLRYHYRLTILSVTNRQ